MVIMKGGIKNCGFWELVIKLLLCFVLYIVVSEDPEPFQQLFQEFVFSSGVHTCTSRSFSHFQSTYVYTCTHTHTHSL